MSASFDWSAVAPAWDAHRRRTQGSTSPVADALVTALALRPGDRVLELAAGTGDLAHRLAEQVGPDGTVLATDAAAGMVSLAAATLADLPQASTALVDAAATGLEAEAFDAVVCSMGLMFVPQPEQALRECRRVLAPGGRLAAAVWAGPQHNPWVVSVGMAAMMGGLVAGGPPTAPGELFSLADPDTLRSLALDAGLRDVTVEEVPVPFDFASADEHFTVVSSLAGPLAALLAAATPEQLTAVRATAAELVAPHRDADGALHLTGLALVLTARA
jgi:SAM-dependent methyltransferase